MRAVIPDIATQIGSWSLGEVVAVSFAILYLLLAIRENIWCWLCAGISTAIFVYLYFDANLYMESVLNVFYFGMAIYGWRVWKSDSRRGTTIPVTTWAVRTHVVAVAVITLLVSGAGFLLNQYTDAAFPYIDSATTFAAIWATFLVARKVLENWWYWLVIDIVSIFIYWSRGLELTSLLFVLYVIMIPFGLVCWTRSWHEQRQEAITV